MTGNRTRTKAAAKDPVKRVAQARAAIIAEELDRLDDHIREAEDALRNGTPGPHGEPPTTRIGRLMLMKKAYQTPAAIEAGKIHRAVEQLATDIRAFRREHGPFCDCDFCDYLDKFAPDFWDYLTALGVVTNSINFLNDGTPVV